jgi:NADPH-dependent curcumin reductase
MRRTGERDQLAKGHPMLQNHSTNRRIMLQSRPHGAPTSANFSNEEIPLPIASEGQVLLRTVFFSLHPYMRGRMSDGPSYAAPVALGEVMGMTGFTAYMGLLDVGQPRPGETVVVAAASGAVGSVVGQIAKLKGCRAVGIAGGADKCNFVANGFGFDACIDHHAGDYAAQLQAVCAQGIDVYFENVGGAVFDAVLPLLNVHARAPLCGLVANYNLKTPPAGRDRLGSVMGKLLAKRIKVQGFIIFADYGSRFDEFASQMGLWVADGKIKCREDMVDGLQNAPLAFMGLLEGKNFGKVVVKVGEHAAH